MSPQRESASNYNWQSTRIFLSDFAKGRDNNSEVSAGANPAEIAYMEVGDDNGIDSQVSSYRAVRPGGDTGSNPRSEEGKIHSDMNAAEGTDTHRGTQVRLIKRPQNGDSRTPITRWFSLRALEVSDPEDKVALPPANVPNGNPAAVKEGDVIAIEARNSGNSFTIDMDNSQFEFPAQVGY